MAKVDALQRCIDALKTNIPELRGVLLASSEGLPIAHSLSGGAEANRVAAMAAAASSLARRVSDSLTMGPLVEVSISGFDGVMFLYSAGSKAVLAVIGPQGTNAGLVHIEARDTAKEMGDLLGGGSRHAAEAA